MANFGVSEDVVERVCDTYFSWRKRPFEQKYLLWLLSFLKSYNTEPIVAGNEKVLRMTLQKWVWEVLKVIAKEKENKVSLFVFSLVFSFTSNLIIQILLMYRCIGMVNKSCLMTVDGTDCPIYKPKPFLSKFYSHKFKGVGL